MARLKFEKYPYPRRRIIRSILRFLSNLAIWLVIDLKLEGVENLPKGGPLIVVGNHFGFADPVMVLAKLPYWLEFIGGTHNPSAPKIVRFLPRTWGILNVYRGSSSREALIAAQTILAQDGVLGIFPEGGAWANVLRPPRPGVSFIAQQTQAPILPIGLEGVDSIFKEYRLFKRYPVTMRIGKVFGPMGSNNGGRPSREELDDIGHTVMNQIAELISEESRGFYSADPAIREAAKGTELWPWENKKEHDVNF